MESSDFNQKVLSYFSDGAEFEAAESIREYLKPRAFTGSSFEKIPSPDPFSITAEDIVAVSMLSVDIPPRCSEWLLGEGQVTVRHLLEQIPVEADIRNFPSLTDPDGPAWQLWNQLISFTGMGRTKTSKLLARKRNRLIPIYDSVVSKALGLQRSDNDWALWQNFMCETGIRDFRQIANESGALHISDLRVLDIVIWMKEQGWKNVGSSMNPCEP